MTLIICSHVKITRLMEKWSLIVREFIVQNDSIIHLLISDIFILRTIRKVRFWKYLFFVKSIRLFQIICYLLLTLAYIFYFMTQNFRFNRLRKPQLYLGTPLFCARHRLARWRLRLRDGWNHVYEWMCNQNSGLHIWGKVWIESCIQRGL